MVKYSKNDILLIQQLKVVAASFTKTILWNAQVCRISNYGDSSLIWYNLWCCGCLWSGFSSFIQILLNILCNHINLSNGGKSIFRELVLKTGAKLTSVEEAIRASQSNIVILAVPKDFYEKQPIHLLEGKVVIDVSNRNSIYAKGESQVFRTSVTIMCRNDELSWMMSWVGCLLTD